MGKNVYVTPKNRDKWNNGSSKQDKHTTMGNRGQNVAERARQLAEQYKKQKNNAND